MLPAAGRRFTQGSRRLTQRQAHKPTHAHTHTHTQHTHNTRTHARQVVYDINGREAVEAEPLLEALKPSLEQYIYCSSAGAPAGRGRPGPSPGHEGLSSGAERGHNAAAGTAGAMGKTT